MKAVHSAWMAACAAALALASPQAGGQAFPGKPLKIVNGFAAGGSSDIVARFVAQKMAEGLGQPVIVEPKTGAGGVIANDAVAKALPDGYTLLLVTGAFPVQAALLKQLPFDPLRDFAWLTTFTFYPFVVNVGPGSQFRSITDLIGYARANPGKLNYASNGIGTVHHFAAELFNVMAGVEIVGVPFRGGTLAIPEIMAGRVEVLFETMTLTVPLIQSGKLRPLAVTSTVPSPALPGVPTVTSVVPGYEVMSFLGMAATGGTPAAIVDRLNRELRRVLDLADIRQRFIDLGGEPRGSTPEEMGRFVEGEIAKWRKVIEVRKIERQ